MIYPTNLKLIRRFLQKAGGIVEYDADAKIFTGEVIAMRSVVTFQGRMPEELEASFRESVYLYLEMCKEDGVPPEKSSPGRFNNFETGGANSDNQE